MEIKLVMLTDDVPLTKFIRTMLSNRRFKVELNGKQSRWRNQRNCLPQGSVLSLLLFNVYTNDQLLPVATNSFSYADDLCLTTQQKTFEQVETTPASGPNELGTYYNENHLRPNPAKTQLTAFHLKNHQADSKLNVTRNGTKLDHTHSPVYLGITLDRSFTYRNHCLSQDARKTDSRNNLLRKLHGTNWGACPHIMRTTVTALCLSVAEYCCPVWARSTHHKLVDTTLNETCRLITGCIRPTATPDLYVLSGIAPPEIRCSVHCQNERIKQLTDQRHSLHHHQPMKSRLHSRNSFVSTSQPLLCKPAEARVTKWQNQWEATQSNLKKYDIHPKEQLPSGDTLPWRTWRMANRVRSGQVAHSTDTALTFLADKLRANMDDLQKAFDTVDYTILTTKLNAIGIDDSAGSWFKSYLTGRKQVVKINGRLSTAGNITCGVPQGSILGPLLFNIYMSMT